ncbi:MAG: hypothetical protein HZB68_02605 [Candidatus Aenigmarchaeota archaeon]|nr:hypothetical protein [Candidatus Aenigmarchaeota archaeon]
MGKINDRGWVEETGILQLIGSRGLQSYEEDLINAIELWNSEFKKHWPSLEMKEYHTESLKTIYANIIGIKDDNYAKEALSIVNNYLANNTDKEYKGSPFKRHARLICNSRRHWIALFRIFPGGGKEQMPL